MADGPRCQRRKQANPRRNSVRSFSNVSEAASDSDDEDKLHIVEEDSISDAPEEKPTVFQLSASQQLHNGHREDDGNLGPDALIQEIRVKEECITDEEDEEGHAHGSPQQGTEEAVYSEVPEEEQSTPERGGHDENGTPDEFSQLHTCPYCSRGYKRHTSLKEHIKLRHEKSDNDFSCSLCSYTFSYRTQLDRHMTAHKNGREQRAVPQSGGNRKFKCTECSKAFKYKHHLKEHLRIHSGEKPYECSNCKKRFSHSGSYSSHISSKKCVGPPPTVNGLSRTPGVKAALTLSQPTRILLREKVDICNKPLQEQLPPKQIKQEPVNHELKPVTTTPIVSTTTTTTTATTNNGVGITVPTAAPQGVVQTLVVPTVGLVQPISINLSDLQNALKAAMDGNVIRQVVATTNANGTTAKVVGQMQPQVQAMVMQAPQPQGQMISAISLPVVDQEGNAKIIINYNMDPQISTSKINTLQPVLTQPTVAQAKVLQSNVASPKVVQMNSTQPPKVVQVNSTQSTKLLQVNSTQPPKVVQVNSTQLPKVVQVNSTQLPKVVQVSSSQTPKVVQMDSNQPAKVVQVNSQPNITLTQMSNTAKHVPTQINILKPVQTNPNKVPSIIKVTKLLQSHPAQTKHTQPTLLLLRRADGSQGLVVRQLTTVHPNTKVTVPIESKCTEQESSPEKTAMAEKQTSPVQLSQAVEDSSTSKDNCEPEDLSGTLLQDIQIKTEPMSPTEIDSGNQTDCGGGALRSDGEREIVRTAVKTTGFESTAHCGVACGDGFHNYATCLFCDNSPSSEDIFNCLNSNDPGSGTSLSSLLGEDDSGPPVECLLPLLKAYSKDSDPTEEHLARVAESVSLPEDVVTRWFQRMRSKKISLRALGHHKNKQQTIESTPSDPSTDTEPQIHNTSSDHHEDSLAEQNSAPSSPLNLSAGDLIIVKTEESEEEGQAEPLDLSLPKSSCKNANTSVTTSVSTTKQSLPAQEEPLNLTCLKKDTLPGSTIYVTQPTTGPINIVAPLQTLVAIAEPGGVPCLRAAFSPNKRTILIPQLSYTYATPSTNSTAHITNSTSKIITTTTPPSTDREGAVILNDCQEKASAGVESLSMWDGQSESDLSPNRKRRKLLGGQYACDLCDKIFQKSSSLLRHKYEHTGKRPHECGICKKAFKHKHHLIEHTRLHSGEKPYQCDKCGKRFSHSGSYSQHMNHRYSYCKKETHNQPEPASTSSQLDSDPDPDERESEAEEEEEEDDEEQEGERDANEDMEFAGFDMSEIRVVRVGEEYDEDDEEDEEEEGGGGEDEEDLMEEEEAMERQPEGMNGLEEEEVYELDLGDCTDEEQQELEPPEDSEVTDCVESRSVATAEG
ncbi:zinc finger E-box-binding homeobox 1-like isoform X1 [Astyanax mexicanus]|uniref:Zinc finger E-box-binding homeobox 1-like isoform X1 n=1 Tax=Astyanax mexicanus TaxID=7994 RepID=A0A8T2M9D4_ASTMX|nr:zinc finger E-box-binding homeobox 1-like isoform X1 [Astyanax mexicanus]